MPGDTAYTLTFGGLLALVLVLVVRTGPCTTAAR